MFYLLNVAAIVIAEMIGVAVVVDDDDDDVAVAIVAVIVVVAWLLFLQH